MYYATKTDGVDLQTAGYHKAQVFELHTIFFAQHVTHPYSNISFLSLIKRKTQSM